MFRHIVEIDWNSSGMKAFDWGLAFISLALGLWLYSPLWIAGGVIGAAMAWWRPMARMQAAIVRSVVRNRPVRRSVG